MSDLFIRATRQAFRYPSIRGELTTEQLWGLPLLGRGAGAGFDLDTVARTINATVKSLDGESFVETRPNPKLSEAQAMLDVVKHIIGVRQAEARDAERRAARADERQKIRDALAAAEARELSQASREELRARLDALAE